MAKIKRSAPRDPRTQYTRLRNALKFMAKYESIDPNQYDLYNIRGYRILGDELNGKYGVTTNLREDLTPWVRDNFYKFYEAPKKSNNKTRPFTGEFMFLAYNTHFNYYIFGTMKHRIDYNKTEKDRELYETISYRVYGKWTIMNNENTGEPFYHKDLSGQKCDMGGRLQNSRFDRFDQLGNRLNNAYSTNKAGVTASILGLNVGNNNNYISTRKDVQPRYTNNNHTTNKGKNTRRNKRRY